jgi:branched-subunit amino acid aminotransferase/4-amino-4-deoxychorismate lyase
MTFCFINGKLAQRDSPSIGISDAAFMLGEGAFETMLVRNGRVLRLERHKGRLERGLRHLAMPALDWASVRPCLEEFERSVSAEEVILRVQVSRGQLVGGFGSPALGSQTIFVAISEAPKRPDHLRAKVVDWPRRTAGGLGNEFKCLGYANELAARRRAVEAGADIAIMLSPAGGVACADTANVYIVEDGTVVTPEKSSGALPGTVRDALRELLKSEGFDYREADISLDALRQADGVFISNAFLGVCLVTDAGAGEIARPKERIAEFVSRLRDSLLDIGSYGHVLE